MAGDLYFVVSPFHNKNNGITNYSSDSVALLQQNGISAQLIKNDAGLRPRELEDLILKSAPSGSFVEVPDAWGLFCSRPHPFRLHVRMHGPSAFLQAINCSSINTTRYGREIEALRIADFVSSPSLANSLRYKEISRDDVRVFPNPSTHIKKIHSSLKDEVIDVLFVGRFDLIKGADYLRSYLSHLPESITVGIIGIGDNHTEFYKHASIRCQTKMFGWVTNEIKYSLMAQSKLVVILSRYESFCQVISEALSLEKPVLAWNVGGIAENFNITDVFLFDEGDIRSIAAKTLDLINNEYLFKDKEHLPKLNNAYVDGIKRIIGGRKGPRPRSAITKKTPATPSALQKVTETAVSNVLKRDIKLFGISMMNEHSEEMWGSLIPNTISDYRFVSPKPMGYNKKFNKKFTIDPNKYYHYDWRFSHDRLVEDIVSFNPDVIFMFNGNTDHFEKLRGLDPIRKVPIVYSELGWLPQNGHIYFDSRGANHASLIAQQTLSELTGYPDKSSVNPPIKMAKRALLALQLPGDTTLLPQAYPLQLHGLELIKYVRLQIPSDVHLAVRTHPRDKLDYSLVNLENTSFSKEGTFEAALNNIDAVIAVNSTVLIEALSFPVNVYHLGYGIFANKGVAIDCIDGNLGEKWRKFVQFDEAKRKEFLNYLKNRQFNVSAYHKNGIPTDFAEAIYPIASAIAIGSATSEIKKRLNTDTAMIVEPTSKLNKEENQTEKSVMKLNNAASTKLSTSMTKTYKRLAKLYSSPKAFIRDYLFKNSPGAKVNRIVKRFSNISNIIYDPYVLQILKERKLDQRTRNELRKVIKYVSQTSLARYRIERFFWIYGGVNPNSVKYAKSKTAQRLGILERFDLAALLCESGHYEAATAMALACLKENPDIFRQSQYLRLAAVLIKTGNLESTIETDNLNYIKLLSAAFHRIDKDSVRFRKYLKEAKSIAVVGNSPVVRGSKRGREVDQNEVIFRFNSYDTSIFRRSDTGVKTDVWIKSPTFEEVDRKRIDTVKAVYISGTNHLDRSRNAYDFIRDYIDYDVMIVTTPPAIYSSLCESLGAPPSAGAQALAVISDIRGPLPSTSVLGFSTTSQQAGLGPKGQSNQKDKYAHNWSKEVELLTKFIRKPPS